MAKDDNITFATKLMTFSCVDALVNPFVLTALEYYCKVVLSKKDLEDELPSGLINLEAWKRCAREVLQKVDKHLEREPSTPDHCPSCGAAVGESHRSKCIIPPCPNCGRTFYQCNCKWEEVKSLPGVRWTGEFLPLAACRQFGLYGRWLETGFKPCSKDDLGAEEDVERLYREGSWDKALQKWTMNTGGKMPNTNCLRNMRCPNPDCGSEGPFEIQASAYFVVSDDGTDDYSEVSWGRDSSCSCMKCPFSGEIKHFMVPDHG